MYIYIYKNTNVYIYRIINDFGKPRSSRVATLRAGFLSIERVLPRAWSVCVQKIGLDKQSYNNLKQG
jgi:hypothetical protein